MTYLAVIGWQNGDPHPYNTSLSLFLCTLEMSDVISMQSVIFYIWPWFCSSLSVYRIMQHHLWVEEKEFMRCLETWLTCTLLSYMYPCYIPLFKINSSAVSGNHAVYSNQLNPLKILWESVRDVWFYMMCINNFETQYDSIVCIWDVKCHIISTV